MQRTITTANEDRKFAESIMIIVTLIFDSLSLWKIDKLVFYNTNYGKLMVYIDHATAVVKG